VWEIVTGIPNVVEGFFNFFVDTADFLILGSIDLTAETSLWLWQITTGQDIRWTPWSSYGQASQQAVQAGQLEEHYLNLGLNAVTVGGYGFYQTWLEYQRTGDPTAMQQYAGSWFAGAVCGKFANDHAATPIQLPKWARNPLGGRRIRVPQRPAIREVVDPGTFNHNAPDSSLNLDAMSQSAGRPSRPGSAYTEAASSFQSHSLRPGWPGPKQSGNAASVNAQAQALVDEVLTNPDSTFTTRPHSRPEWGGTVTEVYRPDGLGVRFDVNGQFVGFITR
jgi:hypothetical protein